MSHETQLNADYLVNTEGELRNLFGCTHEIALAKCLDHLDPYAKDFIARSPFLCIGTQTHQGAADVSPRGDPCGFVKVLDDKTLLIPDRPGNNRLDTQVNILANPAVGLLFIVPGFDDTLRVNGRAQITRDPAVLAQMAVNDRVPTIAIVVHIDEVFLHCAKAFRRAKLWDPSQHQNRRELPSLAAMVLDQTTGAPKGEEALQQLDADLEQEYRNTMY